MLPTFIIGLREGLEAVLIVSIIAAYLKRNAIARWPMWCGVAVAVAISVGVGVTLQVVEEALPQAQQEAMESVIGLVAVAFVTTMVLWMGKNARGLKGELEGSAGAAARRGTAWALAGMAFLAVVKEGFETAVFLLATFDASTSTGPAALGALLGILAACVVGALLYTGGARLNLARFFKMSAVFLVFVAAGLLLSAIRTAHGASWINIGQQRTVDLSWLAPIGSIRSALVTGVLGIPADPRVIEVVAWLAYLVPVLAIVVWPRRWQLAPARVPAARFALAGACAVVAVALAVAVPAGGPSVSATATLAAGKGHASHGPSAVATPIVASATVAGGTAALRVRDGATVQTVAFPASSRTATEHAGIPAQRWSTQRPAAVDDLPTTLSIDDLVARFGRVPVGISIVQDPGPYQASWAVTATSTLWLANGGILDVQRVDRTVLTLSGGGLAHPRTLTLAEPYWAVPPDQVTATGQAVSAAEVTAQDRTLWRRWVPLVLAVAALWLALAGWRARHARAADPPAPGQSDHPVPPTAGAAAPLPPRRSTIHATR